MTVAKPVSIDHRHIRNAGRAKKPTPAQTALLLVKINLQEMLGNNTSMNDFSDRVMDSEIELLHINEEYGVIWLSVAEHRIIDIGLDELPISEEDKKSMAEEIRQLAPALKAK